MGTSPFLFGEMVSSRRAPKYDSLYFRNCSVGSIEETGLDACSYANFLPPHVTSTSSENIRRKQSPGSRKARNLLGKIIKQVRHDNSDNGCVSNQVSEQRHEGAMEHTKQDCQGQGVFNKNKQSKKMKSDRDNRANDHGCELRNITKYGSHNDKQVDFDPGSGSIRKCSEKEEISGSHERPVFRTSGCSELFHEETFPVHEGMEVRKGDFEKKAASRDDSVDLSDETLASESSSESESDAAIEANSVSSEERVPSIKSCKSNNAVNRWRKLQSTISVVNRISARHRVKEDAGGVGAAAFEGAKIMAGDRSRGRKGMEGLLVRQDKSYIQAIQDFYVAGLKMPIAHFLVGVLLAPVALGLLFTPLYLLDFDGLNFNGVVPNNTPGSPLALVKQRCLVFLNIFLYALSLSTTFGGSPVSAHSPLCLLVANVNTLVGQFLFVFLSGAVFARMSQPSQPIRCSKKAIIKTDDLVLPNAVTEEKYRVLAIRLVLTGPPPCELVDAKIRLTYRIFNKLSSGSLFCSTDDLELVRSEVSYLRYGLMVRHIIDQKSPLYGHTMDTLNEGDVSFSLTIMGMERASMQTVFHLEDYFVCDGDVLWECEYADFIYVNNKGHRILDQSKIDLIKPIKTAVMASHAISRMKHMKESREQEKGKDSGISEIIFDRGGENDVGHSSSVKDSGSHRRTLWKT